VEWIQRVFGLHVSGVCGLWINCIYYDNNVHVCLLLFYFLVKNLLNAGAYPDCSNEDGLTVLHQVLNLFYYFGQTVAVPDV